MVEELHLRQSGFSALPPGGAGVYALFQGERLLYVGLSKSIYARITTHYNVRKRNKPYTHMTEGDIRSRPIPFNRVLVKWCTHHEAKILESELIHKFRPPYNTAICPPIRDYGIDLEALAESAGLSWTAIIEETKEKENSIAASKASLRRFG